ncbi:MAG: hypothetical protein WDN28_07880 [Chthoniobacter sp.]
MTLDTNVVTRPVVLLVPGRFWTGAATNLWSGANWAPDMTGANSTTLAPAADVVFSAIGAQNQNTVVDVNTTISSLTINDPAAVTISGPGVLLSGGDRHVHGHHHQPRRGTEQRSTAIWR